MARRRAGGPSVRAREAQVRVPARAGGRDLCVCDVMCIDGRVDGFNFFGDANGHSFERGCSED